MADDTSPSTPCPAPPLATDSKQATIAAILARARAQRAGGASTPKGH